MEHLAVHSHSVTIATCVERLQNIGCMFMPTRQWTSVSLCHPNIRKLRCQTPHMKPSTGQQTEVIKKTQNHSS